MKTSAERLLQYLTLIFCSFQLHPELLIRARAADFTPPEQNEVSLVRTANTPTEITSSLSRNAYYLVSREITETVQVPYTVEVPYTDYETYYVDETRCGYHNREVCHYREECHHGTVPRQVCHNRRTCRRTPQGEVCSDTTECHVVHEPGGPPVCRRVPSCHYESHYECHRVPVAHTRPVTRYRTETRYRSEQRQRIVTDRIFDHQWGVDVMIIMPPEAVLLSSEQETILVNLRDSETQPEVDVAVDSPIFNYRVMNQTRNGNQIRATLELIAKYNPEDLAEQTIADLSVIQQADDKFKVMFEDRGIVARTTSHYQVELFDKDKGSWIFQGEASGTFGSRSIVIPVTVPISTDHDHLIRLMVHREGIVLSRPFDFQKESHQFGQLNPAPYQDPAAIQNLSIQGEKNSAEIVFKDAVSDSDKVETKYEIKLRRKFFWFLWDITMGEATLDRRQLIPDASGALRIPLATFTGMDHVELDNYIKNGSEINIEISVIRVSPRLKEVSPIRFVKQAKVHVSPGSQPRRG